jgi:hypothetical protein
VICLISLDQERLRSVGSLIDFVHWLHPHAMRSRQPRLSLRGA